MPGGHTELGELAEDAIRREVREETGLCVEVERLLLVQQAIYPRFYHKHKHFVFMDYLCKARDVDVKLDGRELQYYIWVSSREAVKLDMEEHTLESHALQFNDLLN